jgi:enterochelin esterase family protein
MRVWSPEDAPPGRPLRLLLANDGPEYDALSRLTDYVATQIAAGAVPPARVALLAPGDRDQWYSASAAYSRVLAQDVVPALRDGFGVIGAPAGMGASLGALAMLHAQRRFPRTFSGLFLQSGSYFTPRHDAQERGFSRFTRITRFVRDTLRDGSYAMPIPVAITCGRAEENAANNRELASALAAQGYEVTSVEVPDLHNYVGWRDAFDPHLTALLQRAWTR